MAAKTSFGQWLKQRRKTLDVSQETLAQRIGCAAITMRKIESDQRRPSKQMAELLAEHLNISPDERPAFVHFARGDEVREDVSWIVPFHPLSNLPARSIPLIGRDEEVAAICKRLLRSESRLLTLTGPPGIGKTQLALQVAAEVMDDFADGVFLVALVPISDSDLVTMTIANTLGVQDIGPQTPLERLKVFLRDKEILLVLDNFEQILAAARQIAELVAACSWLKILVTSRAPLRIRQEKQIPVAPLVLPDLACLPDVEAMTSYSAVTLFTERAQAVRPDFALTEENAPSIAAICTRLDGLPLAIELISARVKLLSPAALLERLNGRLMLQSDGPRDIEPRHQTLNAAIDWSYYLLSADEQTLFRRLGVFVGGWTLEAAETVCLENLRMNILDGTASLLDKNLVKQDTRTEGAPRFMMLETIREYAFQQLTASGELDSVCKHHAGYFTTLAEHTELDHRASLRRLETEHDNFRTALRYSKAEPRLTVALLPFWMRRGHLREGTNWLSDALARQELGTLTAADRKFRATALNWIGVFAIFQGTLDTAHPHLEGSMALYRELGDREGLADALGNYAMLFVLSGDYERASLLLAEGLSLSYEIRNSYLIAQCLHFLGDLAYSQGQFQRAGAFWEESLVLCRIEHKTWAIAILQAFLSMLALEQGDDTRAKGQLIESLTLLQEIGDRWQTANTLELFACLAVMQAHPNLIRAARILGAAQFVRETLSAPMLRFQLHFNERIVATLRAKLNEVDLKAAWAEGRKMTLEQVIAYALNEIG